MNWKKFKADLIFTGKEFLTENQVVICRPNGEIQDIVFTEEAGDDIQIFNGIIAPGFINCHCHLELSHMKGLIPRLTGLVDFVYAVVNQRYFPEDEIAHAIDNAESEMLHAGIVAVGDICNTTNTLVQKLKGKLFYYNFIEASGWNPAIVVKRFEAIKAVYDAFTNIGDASIVPHAPYSVTEGLWQLIIPYFQNKIVTIHNQETPFENDLFKHASGDFLRMYQLMNIDNTHFTPTGKSSVESYFDKLHVASHSILVHNTFVSQSDIEFIQKNEQNHQASFCLCPNANLYIEGTLPPLDVLMNLQCNLVIGTDSLASNSTLSVFEEIKTIQHHFPTVTLQQLLQWATYNGAQALGIDHTFGSIKKGKQPGLVLVKNVTNNMLHKDSTVSRLI